MSGTARPRACIRPDKNRIAAASGGAPPMSGMLAERAPERMARLHFESAEAGALRHRVASCCVTSIGPAASNTTDHDKTLATWPGPEAISTTFAPADHAWLYQGDGGTVRSVQGIDFWIVGRPSRVNRLLGTVEVKIDPLKPGQHPQLNNQQFNSLFEDTVVKAATTAGASAAILMQISKDQDGTSHCNYRLVVYLAEGAVADGPIQKDPTSWMPTATRFRTVFATPIMTLRWPDVSDG